MPDPAKPKPADKALSKPAALAGATVTPADIARARAKWRRRVPGFEERIKAASAQPD